MSEQDGTCVHLEQLPELPSQAELVKRRRNGWRKRCKAKHPRIGATSGSHPELGWFEIKPHGDSYLVKFCFGAGGAEQSALLSDLCDREELAENRLRFGWLVANMCTLDGLHLRSAIPGPHEAMRESAPILKAADDWRRWAIG
jgi:hypothetical protein